MRGEIFELTTREDGPAFNMGRSRRGIAVDVSDASNAQNYFITFTQWGGEPRIRSSK